MNDRWWNGLEDYILGLDLGTSSLGWAIVECDPLGQPCRVVATGVRRFEAGVLGDIEGGRDKSRATQRRDARGPRRQHWRRQWRMKKLFRLLVTKGLLPPCDDDSADARHNHLRRLDVELCRQLAPHQDRAAAHIFPYRLRATALDDSLPLFAVGRALYHLAQRRGFLSNSKTARDDEDEGKVKSGIIELSQRMQQVGARTLGEYFAQLDPEEQRIRGRWTSRSMYGDEFEAIWNRQAKHHPQLTDDVKQAIREAIFQQRPLKSQRGLIGRCELEKDKRRAPLACLPAQRFRILQRVNDLRVTAPDGEIRELSPDERQRVVESLESCSELSWAAVKKLLGMKKSKEFGRHWVFNMEEGGDKRIVGNRTAAKLAGALDEAWTSRSPIEQETIVDEILSYESDDALARRLENGWNLPAEVAHSVSQLVFEHGYASHSRKAIGSLLPGMEQGNSYSTVRKEVYGESFQAGVIHKFLPPIRTSRDDRVGAFPELRNPAVERAMTELRKVVNAILRRCGKRPLAIHVELTRDLKHARRRRKEMTDRRDRNTNQREEAKERLLREMDNNEKYATRDNILKVRLAEECGWVCPFSGRSISMQALVGEHTQFDIEHIIPFSRSLDNSFINKTLCYHEENRGRKRNRTPWEAYHGTPQFEQIIQRVKRFKGDLRAKKLALFQTEALPDRGEFAEKQLSDTRYISRLASQYLGLLYGGKLKIDEEGTLRVRVIPGRATAYLRQRWKLEKNRHDHRHHAIDALVVAMTNARAIQLLAHAAEEAEERGDSKPFAEVEPPWGEFLLQARGAIERINVSSRVTRKLNGPLHKDTILSKPHRQVDAKGKEVIVHHFRKRLDAMSPQEVEAIVDDRIKAIVKARLEAVGGTPQKVFKDPANEPHMIAGDGRIIPIRKARIKKSDRPMPVGQGSRRRYVNPGSNHHIEIVAVLDDDGREIKWEGVLVSRFQAIERLKSFRNGQRSEPVIQRNHGSRKRFKFSLTSDDHVVMPDANGNEQLYRALSISEREIEFIHHRDARPATVRRKSGPRLRCAPDSLRKAKARKVAVTPLGEIIPARG